MRTLITKTIVLLSLLWHALPVCAAKDNIIIEHYSEDDGLPSNSVNCALKGSEGFMWFGTWYGLSRFDGTRFYNYSSVPGQGLNSPPQKVETLVEDSQGNIWLKTSDWKLFVFIKKQESFHLVADDIKPYTQNIQVIKIQAGADGNVLLLTKSKALLMANTDKNGGVHITRLIDSKGHVDGNYRLLHNIVGETDKYIYWQGTDYDIACVRKGVSRTLVPKTRFASFRAVKDMIYLTRTDGTVTTIDTRRGVAGDYGTTSAIRSELLAGTGLVDSRGNAWTMTDGSIQMYDAGRRVSERFTVPFFGRVCEPEVVEVPGRGVLFLTSGGNVYLYEYATRQLTDIKELPRFKRSESAPAFFDIYCDPQGVIWLSSTQNGVYKMYFPERLFDMISLPGVAAPNGVRALYQMKNGDVLVGLRDKDLLLLDRRGTLKKRYSYAEHPIGSVYYMMRDRSGSLWLSTKGDGLVVVTPDNSRKEGYRMVRYLPDAKDKWSISGRNIYMTYQDTRGHIWVCTLDGGLNLVLLDRGKVRFANKKNAFSHYPQYGQYMEVRNIVEDADGWLWVGTIDGLMSVDSRFTDYRNIRFYTYHRNDVSAYANSDIYSLYRTRQGTVWLSAFGCGVGRITAYDTEKNIPQIEPVDAKTLGQNSLAISLTEDLHGRMWMCFGKSLACYDSRTAQLRRFGAADGLPDIDFEETSSLANANGDMWFGCKQGILVYRAGRRKARAKACPMAIVGLRIGNKDYRSFREEPVVEGSIAHASALTLDADRNTFTIEYAALTFTDQGNISYRYRMEGLDDKWHYNGSQREATFTNLSPGEYTFRVEAIDSDNPDLKSAKTMRITILTPIWAQWWAVLIYMCVAAAAARYIWLVVRRRRVAGQQMATGEMKTVSEDYLKLLEDKDRKFLADINNIIDTNIYNADFGIDTITLSLGISRSSFFKRLKTLTDLSPVDYIKEYRLSKSLSLMRTTDLGVTEIAFQVGFKDAGYFAKCFRKKFGKTPREYLAEIRH